MLAPLVDVDGDVRTLPDARAHVVTRGTRDLEATWPDGVSARLRVRAHADGGHRVDCSVSTVQPICVHAIGVHVTGLPATRVLVDGYHSWDWAGLRDATVRGCGWWGGIWGTPGGAHTTVSLDAPPRVGPLLLVWDGGDILDVVSVGAPQQLRHVTGAPRPLGWEIPAGKSLAADPIRIAPLDRRSAAGAGVPRLRAGDHRPAPRTAGWMSWNCLGPSATAADVLDAAATLVPPGGLALLDDGWMPHWGDWQERDDFDSAIAALADGVHAGGRRFGLWLAPFLVDPRSCMAARRGDLLLRDVAGGLVSSVRSPHTEHVLDASLPASRAHLAALGRRMGRLGVDALKLDFLWAGALPGMRRGMSNIAALRAGTAALVHAYRRAAPRGAVVLGCGAPAAPLVGLLDCCRSGDDSVVNIPSANAPPPPRPWFAHGDLLVRGQSRNLAARSWLWGTTVPPDVDAVSLAAVGDMPPPDDSSVRHWLDLALRSGGPLLDADAPDGRVGAARLRMLRRAQDTVLGRPPRPQRPGEPLSGSAVAEDGVSFHHWPEALPDGWNGWDG